MKKNLGIAKERIRTPMMDRAQEFSQRSKHSMQMVIQKSRGGSRDGYSKVNSNGSGASGAELSNYRDRIGLDIMEADSEYVLRLQLELPEVDPVRPVIEEDLEESDQEDVIDEEDEESEFIGDNNIERDNHKEEAKNSRKIA